MNKEKDRETDIEVAMIRAKVDMMKIDAQVDEQKTEKTNDENEEKPLTQAEFEEYVIKSGAKGSFMVYRSKNKKDELGIDEL